MATQQTFQNSETKTSPYVTETRQTSRGRYVLPFTGIRNQPVKASPATNRESGTVTVDKMVQHDIRKKASIEIAGERSRKNGSSRGIERIETKRNAGTRRNVTQARHERNGAVPPLEASVRCLRTTSGVIYYVKPKERRGILVDENVRHPPCLAILLQYCNIMIYE